MKRYIRSAVHDYFPYGEYDMADVRKLHSLLKDAYDLLDYADGPTIHTLEELLHSPNLKDLLKANIKSIENNFILDD